MLWRWRWNGISLRKRIVPAEDVGTYRGDNRTNYTFVELKGAEKPVCFAIEAGGEIQGSCRPGVAVIAKCERPQAVDEHERAGRILQEFKEFMRESVERGDPAAAEVSDQDAVAEFAEVARGPDHAPRRIHPVSVLQRALVGPARAVNLDKSIPGSRCVIVPLRVLFGVGHEKAAADVLDVKRSKATRDLIRVEGVIAKVHGLEIAVIDFHPGLTEIGDV